MTDRRTLIVSALMMCVWIAVNAKFIRTQQTQDTFLSTEPMCDIAMMWLGDDKKDGLWRDVIYFNI